MNENVRNQLLYNISAFNRLVRVCILYLDLLKNASLLTYEDSVYYFIQCIFL